MFAFPGRLIWIAFSQMMYDHLFVCWHILIDGQSAVKISLFVYFQAMFMQTLQFLQQPSFACLLLAKSCAFAAGASGHSTRNFIFTVLRSGHSTWSCILQLSDGVIQRWLVPKNKKYMHPHISPHWFFLVTYIWSCMLFVTAILQKNLPRKFQNQAPLRPLLGLDLVS